MHTFALSLHFSRRFVCEMSILYSAEGGFELPQRTFDALVKIAHYYSYNASATLAAAASDPWKIAAMGERGLGRGAGGLGDEPAVLESTTTTFSVGGRPTLRMGGNSSLVTENGGSDDSVAVVVKRGNAPIDGPTDSSSVAADDDRVEHRSSSHGRAGRSTESAMDKTAASAAAVPASTRTDSSGGPQQTGSEGGSADTPQQRAAPRNEVEQQPVGDDWYTEGGGRPGSRTRRQGGEDAWSRTAREITRLWVRAVGSLCCPSHSELWPHLIDVGILGALNT